VFRGSARNGEFWFRQAYDAAKSVNSKNALLLATLHLGDLFTRMASLSTAHAFLSEAAELADGIDNTKDSVIMDLSFFGIHGRKELWSDAFRSIVRAETKVGQLLEPGFVNGLENGDGIEWAGRITNMRLSMGSDRSGPSKSPKNSRRPRDRSSMNGRLLSIAANIVSRVEYESVTFSKMQVAIAERKGYSLARQRRFEEGYLAIDSITDHGRISLEILSARITRAKMLLLEVHQLLGSDPLLCVLSESGILTCIISKSQLSQFQTCMVRRQRPRRQQHEENVPEGVLQNSLTLSTDSKGFSSKLKN
jgi:hypothetical protein